MAIPMNAMAMPIAAVAFGMTIFGLAFLFAIPHDLSE